MCCPCQNLPSSVLFLVFCLFRCVLRRSGGLISDAVVGPNNDTIVLRSYTSGGFIFATAGLLFLLLWNLC